MIHIIYLSIIVLMLYWLVRTYDFANRKHKELIRFKDNMRIPFEIFSHYEKAYIDFYRWMTENNVSKKVIDEFSKIFKHKG